MSTFPFGATRRALVFAAALAAALLTTAGAWSAQILHRGNGAEPESLDPHITTGVPEANLQRDLFEGLVAEAADGKIGPGTAERWDISPDGLVYTFHLRADAKWSNGDPVTAQDVVYSFRRLLDPKTASKYAFMQWPMKNGEKFSKGEITDPAALGIKAIGERTVEVTLEQPTPYYIGLLAHHASYIVPRKAIETHAERWTRAGNLVSNGAYKLDAWTPQDRIKLVKNPNYHDAKSLRIDEVYFYPTEDLQAELKRYRAGELDITYKIPPDQIDWAKQNLPNEIKLTPYFGTYYYAFNLTKPPFQGNAKLRQALSLAIDRDAITQKVSRAGEVPAYGWVPPDTLNYHNPEIPVAKMTQAQRDAQAKKLLVEAGYGPGKPIEVEILYNTNELHKRIAIAVASMWDEKLGVKTKLVNQEWKVYLDMGAQKQFQVRRAGWIGDYNDSWTFLELLKGDIGKQNPAGYANAAYDDLLRKSAMTRDLNDRAKLLSDAEKIMIEDTPIAPIFHYVSTALVKPHVQGWRPNVQDVHHTRWLSIKK
jgi:oligopeptide transport system substrate-binding protein